MKKELLVIPMYRLHSLKSVDDQQYHDDSARLYRRDNNLKDRQEMFETLEWAMENPDYDFKSFPSYEDLRHSNADIFRFLRGFYEFMKANKLNEESPCESNS